MARDRVKNVYFTVGIPRGSDLLRRLEEESRQSGTSIPKLIPVKLNEFYSGSQVAVISSKEGKREETRRAQPKDAEANALAFLNEEED